MKPDCLNDRNLILLHYGETPDGTTAAVAAAHLNTCTDCRSRQQRLAAELARIPVIADPDPAVGTRIAARVTERLNGKRRWLPAAGAAVAGAVALTMAVVVWMPGNQQPATDNPQLVTSNHQQFVGPPRPAAHQATLDLDLLEQLDLLEELETLQAIEGV